MSGNRENQLRPSADADHVELPDRSEPVADAQNSLTNVELNELAKKYRPPAHWFEGDEEQLFGTD